MIIKAITANDHYNPLIGISTYSNKEPYNHILLEMFQMEYSDLINRPVVSLDHSYNNRNDTYTAIYCINLVFEHSYIDISSTNRAVISMYFESIVDNKSISEIEVKEKYPELFV